MERKKWREPNLPAQLEQAERPEELIYMEKIQESTVEGWSITGADLCAENLQEMTFRGCVFQGCRFSGSNLKGASFVDVEFRHCNFSGAKVDEAYFCRCKMTDIKALASQWIDCRLQYVAIEHSNMQQCNLSGASLEQVRLTEVDFSESWWNECKQKQVQISRCDFIKTSFFKTQMQDMDFTTSQLEGITVSTEGKELKGAVVNVQQAAELARIFGVIIR